MALGWWLAAGFALASAALAHPARLRALDGVAVGHRQRVALPGEEGRSLEVRTALPTRHPSTSAPLARSRRSIRAVLAGR
jgi:hypothetical protein